MVAAYSRDDYSLMPTDDLLRRLARGTLRMERAPSTEAWMVEAFGILELKVVLTERGHQTQD